LSRSLSRSLSRFRSLSCRGRPWEYEGSLQQ
jgi:hypothetical protein